MEKECKRMKHKRTAFYLLIVFRHSPDVPTLSRILGHADAAFTYKVYCHADQTSMKNGMEMMEIFISIDISAVNE